MVLLHRSMVALAETVRAVQRLAGVRSSSRRKLKAFAVLSESAVGPHLSQFGAEAVAPVALAAECGPRAACAWVARALATRQVVVRPVGD